MNLLFLFWISIIWNLHQSIVLFIYFSCIYDLHAKIILFCLFEKFTSKITTFWIEVSEEWVMPKLPLSLYKSTNTLPKTKINKQLECEFRLDNFNKIGRGKVPAKPYVSKEKLSRIRNGQLILKVSFFENKRLDRLVFYQVNAKLRNCH